MSREGSSKPGHMHSFARALASCAYTQSMEVEEDLDKNLFLLDRSSWPFNPLPHRDAF